MGKVSEKGKNYQKMADDFIGVYPVQKTLRFELIPVGRTLEYIERDGVLDVDEHRADSYQKVKKIIDRYHKAFIEEALNGVELQGLEEYETAREEKDEKRIIDVQTNMRKQIAKCFSSHPKFKVLWQKEMIREKLISFVADHQEEKELIEEFRDFTTYFKGFNDTRKNMYSEEMKSTAIANRIVNQNLPRFADNIKAYEQFKKAEIFVEEQELLSLVREKADIDSVNELFRMDGFGRVLTQRGIDAYNYLLGGSAQENGRKIKGLNEYVNLYNQKVKEKRDKLPGFHMLYKQILGESESASFVLEKFETDQEVLAAVSSFMKNFYEVVIDGKQKVNLYELIKNLETCQLDKIYITNDEAVNHISNYLFGDWSLLKKALSEHYDLTHMAAASKKSPEKYEEMKEKTLKDKKVYSIAELNEALQEYAEISEKVESYFMLQIEEKIDAVKEAYLACESLLVNGMTKSRLCKDEEAVMKLKKLLDAVKRLQLFVKPLLKGAGKVEKDEIFYVELTRINDELENINSLYNKTRNYVTKKPYSLEKFKLNFNRSTLLDGWDISKEKVNLGTIFIKEGCYYLGIMNAKSNRVMEEAPEAVTRNVYQKMEYKLLPGPNKMLPKVFFSKSRIEEFAPDEELLKKYYKGTHKKGENFNREDCHRLIDFFKDSIKKNKEWSGFDFCFSETETYEDISGFYKEVEEQGYKINFRDVDEEYIDRLVENGQLYLFQIYNKDFSPYSKGKPNLHTIYWKMLFSPENLQDVVYKLNGEAEIFYRRKSIEQEDIVCYKANMHKYHNEQKAAGMFPYDIIKDKRFTVDKFQFHVPVTMNFKAAGATYFNRRVREKLYESQDMHIIGIDRGERNLLYFCIIDMQGNIIEQFSLNEIVSENHDGTKKTVDYHLALDKREKENKAARQNWKSTNTIKELKEGYLSQAVHIVAGMMIRYNAILVLEDLNTGFMRSRQKFEKQIYQKFEKMLIDKLNYLIVDKEMAPKDKGGALNAYQLTNKFESFQKLGKQSGFLFYVPAWNTSKMDPTTGFVKLLDTRYETREKTRTFISKFRSISYNDEENCFTLLFDYSDFTARAFGSKTDWCLYTEGARIERYRNPAKNSEWDTRVIENLTDEFILLFEKYNIVWREGDLREQMIRIEDADFYRRFMHLMTLVLQMRNSDNTGKEDWLASPVKNSRGELFRTNSKDKKYPCDADANGAYNIARKGMWIVEQIKKADISQLDKVKLAISNREWLAYAQEHNL